METIDFNELPDEVLNSILYALGWDNDGSGTDADKYIAEAETLSTMELMEKYLQWHGIIGYTEKICNAYDSIKGAKNG